MVNGAWGSNHMDTNINDFLTDLFLIHNDTDIANFGDNNTPYLSATNVDFIESLGRASVYMFENNFFKGSADTCHFLVSTSQEVNLVVNNFKIKTVTVKNC